MAAGRLDEVSARGAQPAGQGGGRGVVPDQRCAFSRTCCLAIPRSRPTLGCPTRRTASRSLRSPVARWSPAWRRGAHPPLPLRKGRGGRQHRSRCSCSSRRWRHRPSALAAALFVAGASTGSPTSDRTHTHCAAADLRPIDHQLAARGVVRRRGPRWRHGCGRDRAAHPSHNAFGRGGVVFSAVVLAAYPFLLRGPDQDDHPSTS